MCPRSYRRTSAQAYPHRVGARRAWRAWLSRVGVIHGQWALRPDSLSRLRREESRHRWTAAAGGVRRLQVAAGRPTFRTSPFFRSACQRSCDAHAGDVREGHFPALVPEGGPPHVSGAEGAARFGWRPQGPVATPVRPSRLTEPPGPIAAVRSESASVPSRSESASARCVCGSRRRDLSAAHW